MYTLQMLRNFTINATTQEFKNNLTMVCTNASGRERQCFDWITIINDRGIEVISNVCFILINICFLLNVLLYLICVFILTTYVLITIRCRNSSSSRTIRCFFFLSQKTVQKLGQKYAHS